MQNQIGLEIEKKYLLSLWKVKPYICKVLKKQICKTSDVQFLVNHY